MQLLFIGADAGSEGLSVYGTSTVVLGQKDTARVTHLHSVYRTHTHTHALFTLSCTHFMTVSSGEQGPNNCALSGHHTHSSHTLVHESSLIATQINAPVSNDCRDFSSHNVFDGYTSGFRPGFALFLILFCLEFLYALLFHLFTASGQDIIVANNPLRG